MSDSLQLTTVAQVVGGLLLLILGKRLFWLFVGLVGFFAGVRFGDQIFAGMENWILLLLSLGIGVLGALLALALQRVAVVVAGGVIGGMMAMELAPSLGLHTDGGVWLAFIGGALLAAALFSALFDPMLIGLSALAGAVMITDAFDMGDVLQVVMTVVLFVIGLAVQLRISRRQTPLA